MKIVFPRACLKIPERGCVVRDQPQQASNTRSFAELAECCGWSATQPRSFFKQALRCRRGLIISLGLLEAVSVHGQEALFNSISMDRLTSRTPNPNVAVELRPDQPHLGPVQYTLGTYLGLEGDDNVNNSQSNPQADTIIRGGLNLGFVWPATEQSDLRFSSDVGYATYLAHTRSDTVEIAPGSALSWKVSFEDGSLTFFDQFNYSQEVITLASVSGVGQIPRLDNTVGTRAQWQPGHWQFELSLSRNDYFSTAAAFNYLNRASEYVSLRGARRLTEDTQMGLETSVSVTEYDLPIQSNNRSYSLGPYLEWKVTHFLTASLRGGPTFYSFDAAGPQPASTLDAYYAGLNLTHQLTEFVSHNLSVQRSVSLGMARGNNYTEQLTASYSVNWAARQHLNLGLSLVYENGSQPLTGRGIGMAEKFHRLGISPSLAYQFTEKFSGSLNYSHWERTSNFPGNNYGENSLGLQLRYAF